MVSTSVSGSSATITACASLHLEYFYDEVAGITCCLLACLLSKPWVLTLPSVALLSFLESSLQVLAYPCLVRLNVATHLNVLSTAVVCSVSRPL